MENPQHSVGPTFSPRLGTVGPAQRRNGPRRLGQRHSVRPRRGGAANACFPEGSGAAWSMGGASVGRGLPTEQGGVTRNSPTERVDGGAEKNDGVAELGRR
jgi:hypothetical protein